MKCAVFARNTELEFTYMFNFVIDAPKANEAQVATVFFNITGTLAKSLPDAIYYCY